MLQTLRHALTEHGKAVIDHVPAGLQAFHVVEEALDTTLLNESFRDNHETLYHAPSTSLNHLHQPPKFKAQLCLAEPASTTVVDAGAVRCLMQDAYPALYRDLTQFRFWFQHQRQVRKKPVFADGLVNFDPACMYVTDADDPPLAAMHVFEELCAEMSTDVDLDEGSVLVVDNHRMLTGVEDGQIMVAFLDDE